VYAYYDTLLEGQGTASVLRISYDDLAAAFTDDAGMVGGAARSELGGAGGGSGGGDGGADGCCAARRIQAFLGAAAAPPKALAVTVKQTRRPLKEGIENFDDLAFAFSCTKYAGCFACYNDGDDYRGS
jgi:hypothetical protein